MPEYIIGPNGKLVKVTAAGELLVRGTQETPIDHQNEHDGEVWTFPIDALDPDATDKKFAYIQNTSDTLNLYIAEFRFTTTVAGSLEVLRVTGVAAGGSAVTLVNANENFAADTPTGLFQTAADITALTDGGKHGFMNLLANVEDLVFAPPGGIILGKNGAIALNWVPSTGILTGTIKIYTAEPERE